jgi:hypothetical protein
MARRPPWRRAARLRAAVERGPHLRFGHTTDAAARGRPRSAGSRSPQRIHPGQQNICPAPDLLRETTHQSRRRGRRRRLEGRVTRLTRSSRFLEGQTSSSVWPVINGPAAVRMDNPVPPTSLSARQRTGPLLVSTVGKADGCNLVAKHAKCLEHVFWWPLGEIASRKPLPFSELRSAP